jgi:NitT/TauT family transport system permease protein
MKSETNKTLLRKVKNTYQSAFWGGGTIILLLALWEFAGTSGLINPLFSSSPSRIVKTGIELVKDGSLIKHIKSSGRVFITGYIMAVIIGVPIGIMLGWFKRARMAFGPLIAALYTTPRIALMPLFIIWFGLGIGSRLALVMLSAVFYLIINMQIAIANLDADLTNVAVAYGANRWKMFLTVAMPQSVPFLMSALRLASGRALVGVVGSEVFGGNEGLGFLIQYAGATFQTDKVFVCVIVLAAFGITLDKVLLAISAKFNSWRGNA